MKARAIVLILALMVFGAGTALAQTNVTVDAGAINLGYMNVFNLPAPDGDGAYQYGSAWGMPDLAAVYAGDVVTLSPNSIGDPNEYWYQCVGGVTPPDCGGPGAPGNKSMEANLYAEPAGSLPGQTVTFSGEVLANTFTDAHVVKAFIKDFAPDFSSYVESAMVLTTTGAFTLSLETINDPARHVQYGFQTTGENVWITDVGQFGTMIIGPHLPVASEKETWGGIKSIYR